MKFLPRLNSLENRDTPSTVVDSPTSSVWWPSIDGSAPPPYDSTVPPVLGPSPTGGDGTPWYPPLMGPPLMGPPVDTTPPAPTDPVGPIGT